MAQSDTPPDCESRLQQSLIIMLERPLMKEEAATALMWLRMDAEAALAVGDEAGCLREMDVVELLLRGGE